MSVEDNFRKFRMSYGGVSSNINGPTPGEVVLFHEFVCVQPFRAKNRDLGLLLNWGLKELIFFLQFTPNEPYICCSVKIFHRNQMLKKHANHMENFFKEKYQNCLNFVQF